MPGGSPRPWPNMQAPLPPHMLPSSLHSSVPLPHGSAEEVAGVAMLTVADAGEALALDEEPAFAHSEAVPEDIESPPTLDDPGAALALDEEPAFAHSEALPKEAEELQGLDPGEFEWTADDAVEAALSSLELAAVGKEEAEQPSATELGELPDDDLS